jgi:hypothetical protein
VKKLDTADVIGLAGLMSLITGVAMWSRPAALVTLGALLLVYAYVTAK